jgi:glycosyltransferase involved in cell wall biosynthesis
MGTKDYRSSVCIVVIPCYNEEKRLRPELFEAFIHETSSIHFLFVNDGSTDRTLAILEGLRDRMPVTVEVLNQARNQGKAEAVRAGMKWAIEQRGASYTGFWDADLATPLSEIPRLLALLRDNPTIEIILGSRVRLLGRFIDRRPARHYSGRIFATLASIILRLPVYDTQCGAKLFRVTPTLQDLLGAPFLSRWIFDVELLARFLKALRTESRTAPPRIHEEPLVMWQEIGGSKLTFVDTLKALNELLVIRQKYFRNK